MVERATEFSTNWASNRAALSPPASRWTAPRIALLCSALLWLGCRDDQGTDRARHQPAHTPARGIVQGPTPPVAPSVTSSPAVSELPAPAEPATADPTETAAEDDGPPDCAPAQPALKPLQLLRFRFAQAVKGRDPVSKLFVARPGQRVWAHFTVRNRSGRDRCLRLKFSVNGHKRTQLVLKVGESWSWRTWAYITLRPTDWAGTLDLVATDDQGNVVVHDRLPIVPEAKR